MESYIIIYYLIYLFLIEVNLAQCGWIDPDTNDEFHTTLPLTKGDDREYQLVFSDEFETDGRSFKDGEDSKWTALDKNDYTNDALHYYKSENVQTTNGVLNITTSLQSNDYKAFNEKTKKYYVGTKHVQSAMVQGWNKFCMTGGIVEFSAKLPGKSSVGGLWPALWLLGNLARATYVGSSDWVWPFSYDTCDLKRMYQQEVNACRKINHYGMDAEIGRGAPEIDILEAMAGEKGKLPNTPIQRPYFSSSYQVAPGIDKNRPLLMHQPKPGFWYEGLEYGDPNTTSLNPFFYGVTLVHTPKAYTYQSDAISANTQINETHFNSQNRYRVEWEPPTEGNDDGYIKWYLNDVFLYGINGHSLNITGSKIPDEPMYLIINTAVASSWGFPVPCPEGCDCSCYECGNPDCDCALPTGYCDNFPANFEVDYVRVYQAKHESKHKLGCSTKERPTKLFIKAHKKRYMEEDDKVPLQPIMNGGAKCTSNSDCGGPKHGSCINGVCTCSLSYIGSSCLSSYGYDNEIFNQRPNSLPKVVRLSLPKGLVIMFVIIGIAFLVIYIVTLSGKRRVEKEYREAKSIASLYSTKVNGKVRNPRYYGTMTNENFPSEEEKDVQKNTEDRTSEDGVRTYVMIDGRLIDNNNLWQGSQDSNMTC